LILGYYFAEKILPILQGKFVICQYVICKIALMRHFISSSLLPGLDCQIQAAGFSNPAGAEGLDCQIQAAGFGNPAGAEGRPGFL